MYEVKFELQQKEAQQRRLFLILPKSKDEQLKFPGIKLMKG